MTLYPNRCKVLSVLVMGIASAVLSAPAHAASCDSAARIAVDLWDEYGKYAKQAGCTAASAATVAASSGATGDPQEIYQECLSDAEMREKLVRQMIATWNRLAANRWATIGPRQLRLNAMQQGTIVGPGTRLFVTPAPLHMDAIDIAITKQAFQGAVEVTVCSYAPGDVKERRWNFTMESGKKNTGKLWLQRINGVEGQLVSVHIVGKSVAKKLRYGLNVSPR